MKSEGARSRVPLAAAPLDPAVCRAATELDPRRRHYEVILILALAAVLSVLRVDPIHATPNKLEYLELGPLHLTKLAPGTLTILKQIRIVNGKTLHRFQIKAQSGRFDYLGQDGTTPVLSGSLHALAIDGYVHFTAADDVDSMIVEQKDRLTFILSPERYQLPAYGGGLIKLTQKQVWVGNETGLDLTKQSGSIYFATDGVRWSGLRLSLDAPRCDVIADAASTTPSRGVRFIFDLASASLTMADGDFLAEKITSLNELTAATNPHAPFSLSGLHGAVHVVVQAGQPRLSAQSLATHIDAATLADAAVPLVASGDLSVSGARALGSWQQNYIALTSLKVDEFHFAPDAVGTAPDAAWASAQLVSLLQVLKIADPEQIRTQAIKDATEALANTPQGALFASFKRALIQDLVAAALAKAPHVTSPSVSFGQQSIRLAARVDSGSLLPGASVSLPLDAEFTVGIQGEAVVLRPVIRMLLLGPLSTSHLGSVDDFLTQLKSRLGALVAGDAKLAEVNVPVSLSPGTNVDLSSLSGNGLTITSPPFHVAMALKPAILINSDAIWILSGAEVQ